MITNVPGVGQVDDSIPAGQPGGPLPVVPPNSNVATTTDPVANEAVPFSQDVSGLGPIVSPTVPTP